MTKALILALESLFECGYEILLWPTSICMERLRKMMIALRSKIHSFYNQESTDEGFVRYLYPVS